MQQLQSLWTALDTRRRIIAVATTAAMFAAIVLLAKSAASPGMSLLYAGLEDAAAGEVIQALEARAIRYDVRGDAIFVPSRARDETRLMLAANGLPTNSHSGYELLESLSGFGTTSQMFDAAYWRAKEGELARTIVASPHIRAARVHLAHAGTAPFRREVAPKASVSVTTSGAILSASQARAIRFLVASAVSGMTPEDVSVIDGTGGLVYGPETDLAGQAQGSDRAQDLRRNVERLLEAHVGHGRAVVELSLETVTDRETITERLLDPDTRVTISSEVEESEVNSTDTRRQGVTVASNLPDGDAAANEDGSAQSRESQSRQRTNFEVSETRRELERQPGAIRRITVAVLIDGTRETGPDGQSVWTPRPAEELEALRELVASAVGFDAARGDVITLRSLPFEPIAALGTDGAANRFLTGLDVMSLLRWAFLLLALLVLGAFVVRPLLQAAGRGPSGARDTTGAAQQGPALLEDGGFAAASRSDGFADVYPPEEDPVDRLRRLIDARGEDSVQVLRHWMDERKEPS